MSSLFDIAKSGVQSYRQSLAVTGQNIANINTDGYRRREADLGEVTATQGGITATSSQAGLGVRVEGIRRSFDAYLLSRANSSTSEYEKVDSFLKQVAALENTLLPDGSDLGTRIGQFFDSLQQVSASPGDLAPRLIAIEEGRSLANGFKTVAGQLSELKSSAKAQANDTITGINLLTKQLGEVNGRVLSSGQGAQSPNSVLDLRDKIVADLSKLVDVTVEYTDRGVANLTIGSTGAGPALVTATSVNDLGILEKPTGLQPVLVSGSSRTPTNQVQNGMLAGLIDSYSFVDEVIKDIDQLAVTVSQEMNTQHRLGLTMDGVSGGDMFTASGLSASLGSANRGDVVTEITVTDSSLLPRQDMSFVYRDDLNAWSLTTPNIEANILGSNQVVGSGFSVSFNGAPMDGDVVLLSSLTGAAQAMEFRLERGQDIAAAASTLVSQDSANTSDAVITATKVEATKYSEPPSIDTIFRNSDSPIVATQFLKEGVVATIPAGAQNVNISSFDQQAQIQFELSSDEFESASNLEFTLEGTTYNFDLSYSSAYPLEDSASTWQEVDEIGLALNRGVLRSTDSSELSLADLGIFVSAAGGNLTLAAAAGTFSSTAQVTHASGTASGLITSPAEAANIQIFTREGRHIAGTPLTLTQIATLVNSDNGFADSAEYRADYLNITDDAYRGMDLDVLRSDGMYRATIGADGSTAQALGDDTDVPVSATNDYTIDVALANGRTEALDIPAGSSAEYAASLINDSLTQLGVQAQASTRVLLSGFSGTGTVNFYIEGLNQSPIEIEADIAEGQLSSLVDVINVSESLTGIRAHLTEGGDRIVLESDTGKDILFSNVAATSPSFEAEVIGLTGNRAANPITLNDTSAATVLNSARFSGTIDIVSGDEYTISIDSATPVAADLDPHTGGLVAVDNNMDGTIKTLSFEVNSQADTNSSDVEGLAAVAAGGFYYIDLPEDTDRPRFVAQVFAKDLDDLSATGVSTAMAGILRDQAPVSSIIGGVAIDSDNRPEDGSSVYVTFADDTYAITMEDGEVVVTGGEAGRLTAYYDSDDYLRVVASGSLSAQEITIPSDTTNDDAASLFGLTSVTNRTAGTSFALPNAATTMSLSLNGVDGTLEVDTDGTLDVTGLPTGVTAEISSADTGEYRVVFSYDAGDGPIAFDKDDDTQALGFKTIDYNLRLRDGTIEISSLDTVAVDIMAGAESLSQQRIRMGNLPNEDLIVVVTGDGALSLSASYDLADPLNMIEELDIQFVNESGTQLEVFDAITGHSIATRALDHNSEAVAAGYHFRIDGAAEIDDVFHIAENVGGVGDGRNVDALLALQNDDVAGAFSGGFQKVFASILTTVGASVRSNDIALAAAESNRDAAIEAETSFSGVNLDMEAAALLEYQQAYQASARVLTTARELFETLIQSV
jgi:flagellar hook-associated protein 1 FlgK